MSDRIEASDILSEDATAKIKEFNDSIKQTAEYAEWLSKVVNKMGKTDFFNSSSIAQHNKDVVEATKHLNSMNAEKIKSSKLAFEATKQVEKEAAAINKIAKEQENLNSVYQQTLKKHNDLSKAAMELSVRGRENGKVFKSVKIELDALRSSLDKAEQGAGRFQRNVGNYKSGFNGLSSSVNQLTREMPAFANSMQTGFMAISNNLPIFFDEISKANKELKALKAQGEQVPSLFSSLASSIFTFGTLLSVGVTLLTVYGKEMVNFIIDLAKGDEAFKLSAERQSTFYEKLKEYHDAEFESILRLRVLKNEMSEKDADLWRENKQKKNEQIILESNFNKEREDIATKFNLNINKINGKVTGKDFKKSALELLVGGEDLYMRNRKADEVNAAYLESKKRFDFSIQEMERSSQLKIDEIKSGKDTGAKGEKEKAFKLTDQDKRNIERMEYIQGLKEKAIEIELKGIEAVSEAEKNANQVEVTDSDEKIKNHGIDIDNMLAMDAKGIAEAKALKDKEAAEDKARLQSTFDFYESLSRAKYSRLESELNADIDLRQRNILQQQQLAIAGKDNTLAFEKAAAAKDELRKQELALKEEKRQKRVALFKLIAAYADKGDSDQATSKAFIQMAIAGAIAGSYFEGTENVGEDLKGNKVHSGRDGYHIAVDGSERILTGAQNKLIGDLSNDELAQVARAHNEGVLPKYITDNGIGSFAENLTNSLLLHQVTAMNEEIKGIKQALKERPVSQVNLNNLGEVIDTKIINGFHKKTVKKNSSPLNYL